jgi:hypothetical protein
MPCCAVLQGPGCFKFDVPGYCHGKHHHKHDKHDGNYHHKHHHGEDEGYYHGDDEGPSRPYGDAAAKQASYGSDEDTYTDRKPADYDAPDGQDYPERGRNKYDRYYQGEPPEGYEHLEEYPWHGRHKRDHDGYHRDSEPGYGEEHEWQYEHQDHDDGGYGHNKKHHDYGHHDYPGKHWLVPEVPLKAHNRAQGLHRGSQTSSTLAELSL